MIWIHFNVMPKCKCQGFYQPPDCPIHGSNRRYIEGLKIVDPPEGLEQFSPIRFRAMNNPEGKWSFQIVRTDQGIDTTHNYLFESQEEMIEKLPTIIQKMKDL